MVFVNMPVWWVEWCGEYHGKTFKPQQGFELPDEKPFRLPSKEKRLIARLFGQRALVGENGNSY